VVTVPPSVLYPFSGNLSQKREGQVLGRVSTWRSCPITSPPQNMLLLFSSLCHPVILPACLSWPPLLAVAVEPPPKSEEVRHAARSVEMFLLERQRNASRPRGRSQVACKGGMQRFGGVGGVVGVYPPKSAAVPPLANRPAMMDIEPQGAQSFHWPVVDWQPVRCASSSSGLRCPRVPFHRNDIIAQRMETFGLVASLTDTLNLDASAKQTPACHMRSAELLPRLAWQPRPRSP
jgi:hypothetical protein